MKTSLSALKDSSKKLRYCHTTETEGGGDWSADGTDADEEKVDNDDVS